jgi:hypothetical protein
VETRPTTQNLNSMSLMFLDKEKLAEGLNHTTQLMQQHREEGNARQIRHEQRRRKFIRQQDTSLMTQTKKFFEQEVVGQLLNVSQGETDELNFRNEVFNYKDIMIMNRKNRDSIITNMNIAGEQRQIAWEKVEAKREFSWIVKLDTRSQLRRRDTLQIASKAASRCDATQMISEFLNKMLDIVDWTVTCREIGGFSYRSSNPLTIQQQQQPTATTGENEDNNSNNNPAGSLPELIWSDLRRLASSSLPFASPLPDLVKSLPSTIMLPFNISQRPRLAEAEWVLTNKFSGSYVFDKPSVPVIAEDGSSSVQETNPSEKLSLYLANQDWLDYINKLNEFNESKPKTGGEGESFPPVEYPDFQRDALLTPSWLFQTDPQYVFGESVVQIRSVVNPIPEQPEPNINISNIPLKMALFGTSDYSKQQIINQVTATIPRMKVISIEGIIKNLLSPSAVDYTQDSSLNLSTLSAYQSLIRDIQLALKKGESIGNKQYAQLLIQEIQQIPDPSNGFIITDYPNSKEQLVSFMEEVSNIRYDHHRPQPKDFASLYSPLKESEDLIWEIGKCGLDVLLCTDMGNHESSQSQSDSIELPLKERIRARKNLYTQETIYLTEEIETVKGLQYLYDPSRPYATTGLALTKLERDVKELTEFCVKVRILKTVDYGKYELAEEAVTGTVRDLCDQFLSPERLTQEYWDRMDFEKAQKLQEENERKQKEAEEEELRRQQEAEQQQKQLEEEKLRQTQSLEAGSVDNANSSQQEQQQQPTEVPPTENQENPVEGETVPVEEKVVAKRLPVILTNSIPPKLAAILHNFWNSMEIQNHENGKQFNSMIRDIRFQIIQRRRLCMDTTYTAMLRYDSRQELFNKFREGFNAIENNFRYDPDCIAELFLRTLQLRNEISKMSEARYKDVQSIIEKTEKDQNILVLIYHLKCEGVFLLQNELNRFYSFLNLIFDFTKSIQTYEIHEKILNELEVLLPTTIYEANKAVDPKAAKEKPAADKKKDKNAGATFAPYREAFPPFAISLNNSLITNIPVPKEEEVVDPKAKAKKVKHFCSVSKMLSNFFLLGS